MNNSLVKEFLRNILPHSWFLFGKDIYYSLRYALLRVIVPIRIKLSLPIRKKRSKIKFEIHLAEHCNLNCRACSNFSSIAEPSLVDVEEFTRDMTRLGNIFSHECSSIFLIGGEPLLHPDIIKLMKVTRENFTNGKIDIFSNGILLPSQKDDFWEACHDYNIGIIISLYPIKLDLDKIKSQAQKFGVNLQWAHNKETFFIEPLNLKGTSDIKLNFGLCHKANSCTTLKHGKLFTCSFAPNVHHFNKKFNTNIEITSDDYIDIYDENLTADKILQKLSEPIPACRFCNVLMSHRKIVQWGHTQGKIEEWT